MSEGTAKVSAVFLAEKVHVLRIGVKDSKGEASLAGVYKEFISQWQDDIIAL